MTQKYNEPFIPAPEVTTAPSSDLENLLSKPLGSAYSSVQAYKDYEEIAKALAQSPGIPKRYQGNVGGCIMALDLANRMKAHVLAIMQNLYDVHGQPAWSSKFVRAQIDASGFFEPLQFHYSKEGTAEEHTTQIFIKAGEKPVTVTEKFADVKCWTTTKDLRTGAEIKGPVVSKLMAFREGWLTKPGSKWKTMPEMMLLYRATSFFANAHCPGLLMGLITVEEAQDIGLSIAENQAATKGNAGLVQHFSDETSNVSNPGVDPEFLAEMEAAEKAQQKDGGLG